MKRFLLLPFLSLLILVAVSSCKHNPYLPDELTDDPNDTIGNVICDTTSLSLAADIRPIIQGSCYSCHSAAAASIFGAGIDLETYPALQTYAGSGLLSCAISHGSGCVPMPSGGSKLPDCQVSKIVAWINAGALNN